MAKASYAKLNLKTNTDVIIFKWGDQEIEVKKYLPIDDKIEIVTNVLQLAHDPENNFANPMKIEVYTVIECVEKYTNLNITDKQKENPQKLYDALVSSHFWGELQNRLGNDFEEIKSYITKTVEAFYKYRTSALGILDTISGDYSNLNLDATEIQKKLADPNNMEFLKDVLTKLN